jgi:hypothetical protein
MKRDFFDWISDAVDTVGDFITDTFDSATEQVGDFLESSGLADFGEEIMESVSQTFNELGMFTHVLLALKFHSLHFRRCTFRS